MTKHQKNHKGVGAIGVLLAVIVIAVVAVSGWAVYNHYHKKVSTSATTTSSTSTPKTTTPQSVDSYAGWNTYCDDGSKYCFKYPADWTLTTDTSNGVIVTLRNPANSAIVSYVNPIVKDGGTSDFYAADVESLSATSELKVVGGAFSANYLPNYYVVDSSLLSKFPLTVGQTSSFEMAARFTDNKQSTNSGQLAAYPVGKVFTTNAQAKAWFSTDDAKTSLLILKSFYNQ